MKKYILAVIFAFVGILHCHLVLAQVNDQVDKSNKMCGMNCVYELDDKGFMLIKPIDPSKKAYIRKRAFDDRKDFTKLKIEEGVVSIEDYAFYGTNLVKVDLPDTLQYIGKEAFHSAKLKKIKLPDSIKIIEICAFCHNNLKEVVLPKNLQVIKRAAFAGNKKLTEIIIPNTVTSIGEGIWEHLYSGTFQNCSNLETVHFSKSLENIDNDAFKDTNIRNLNLPKYLKTIGKRSFSGAKISELNIPDSVVFIGDDAFEDTKLSYIIISDTTEVSDKAFENATIDVIYCRGDVDTCKENLEDAVSETTVFKSISEMPASIIDEQVIEDDGETIELEENTVFSESNEKIEDTNVDDNVSYNESSAQTIDQNIPNDEELINSLTLEKLKEYANQGIDVKSLVQRLYLFKMKKVCKNSDNPMACECMMPLVSRKLPFDYKLEVVLGARDATKTPSEYVDESDLMACAMYFM